MVATPKAVRVKTSGGWQDVALVGPPGPPSGQMVLIEDRRLVADAADLDFQNIPQVFAELRLVIYARCSIAAAYATTGIQFNGDTAGNYDDVRVAAAGFTFQGQASIAIGSATLGHCSGATSPAGTFSLFEITIPNYASTVGHKTLFARSNMKQGATANDNWIQEWSGWWRSTAAINRLRVFLSSSNFIAGSRAVLYGIAAEPEGMRQNWSDVYCQLAQGNRPTLSIPHNAWTLMPIPAVPSITITRADGTNDDFTRNADGSLTINKPGNYHISASITADEILSDGSNVNLIILKKNGATPTSVSTDHLGGLFNVNSGGTTNQYPGGVMVAEQFCVAGDRIALYAYHFSGGASAKIFKLHSFGIHRTGAGPPGPPGGQISQTYAVTSGYTADRTLNPEATSLTEVARALGSLIDDMKASGLIKP